MSSYLEIIQFLAKMESGGQKVVVFEIICAIFCLSILIVIAYYLYAIYNKPAPEHKYVPSISQFDKSAEVTTVMPVPFGSATCSHDWEIVTDETLEVNHEKRYVLVLKCPKCGLLDKTMQVTSKATPTPAPKSECRHRWDKEKCVILDSAYEQMSKIKASNGQWRKDAKHPEIDKDDLEPWMFRKRYISVRVCDLCGEVDKVVASNITLEEKEEE